MGGRTESTVLSSVAATEPSGGPPPWREGVAVASLRCAWNRNASMTEKWYGDSGGCMPESIHV